ncbi:hypothetical protein Pelo_19565 [Pelomyxa schiedti]|nr:hypothetical protein Pelo_19565 [Pelomyxa schiedti]
MTTLYALQSHSTGMVLRQVVTSNAVKEVSTSRESWTVIGGCQQAISIPEHTTAYVEVTGHCRANVDALFGGLVVMSVFVDHQQRGLDGTSPNINRVAGGTAATSSAYVVPFVAMASITVGSGTHSVDLRASGSSSSLEKCAMTTKVFY